MSAPVSTSMVESRTTNIFRAEFDEEGVYVYQAFRDSIADYATMRSLMEDSAVLTSTLHA